MLLYYALMCDCTYLRSHSKFGKNTIRMYDLPHFLLTSLLYKCKKLKKMSRKILPEINNRFRKKIRNAISS